MASFDKKQEIVEFPHFNQILIYNVVERTKL